MNDVTNEGTSLANCTHKERPPDSLYDLSQGFQLFKFENLTVVRPPLLKSFYWRKMGIDSLNEKLASDEKEITHLFQVPTRHLNSKPLKLVFWIRSMNSHRITLKMKRIRNCQCKPLETQVGFNQYRYLYHCPHRRLVNLSQEIIVIPPNDIVALSMVAYFYMYGNYVLTYEVSCSDSRQLIWNFDINIVTFDPVRSILTRELIPVNIREHRRMAQAIWVRNITMQNLQFRFAARNRGLRLINSNLVVPRQSVWPLIIEYRPSDFENTLDLVLVFENFRCNITVGCKGVLEDYVSEPSPVPLTDYHCSDCLYIVYPNKLDFLTEYSEDRTLMVAVHNNNQKCMKFKWQTYSINGYFNLSFEPSQFTLKPHHSKLCVVQCRTYDKPLHFRSLPAVLEIHRILAKSTQIAQQLLTEVESIDDPKWQQDSYKEHVLLHIELKVKFPVNNAVLVSEEYTMTPQPLMVPMSVEILPIEKPPTITIFEKLFWDYLSRSNFMRNTSKIPRTLTYEEVIQRPSCAKPPQSTVEITTKIVLSYLCHMLAESCRDLSKNHRFIPKDIMYIP